jgi:hypothetical protein
MTKQTVEIDIDKIVSDKIESAVHSILSKGHGWDSRLEDDIIRRMSEMFIQRYMDNIFEKIDHQKMADLVAQRATLEMGKAFVYKGRQ